MILVDVQIPMLDEIYDFELDEEAETEKLAEQILDLIVRNGTGVQKPVQEIFLYAVRRKIILNFKETLTQQGIGSGERLIVI